MTETTSTDGSEYRLDVVPLRDTARIWHQDTLIAESNEAMMLIETNHPDVYYFPGQDVHLRLLIPSEHTSHCPFKGDARYWHYQAGGNIIENVAWSYPTPLQSMAQIAGRIAFYQHILRLDLEPATE